MWKFETAIGAVRGYKNRELAGTGTSILMRRLCVAAALRLLVDVAAQRLYGRHATLDELMSPTYHSERCAFYDVRKLSHMAVRQLPRGNEEDVRRWPRLGELERRDGPNLTVCDGYGISRQNSIVTPCTECPGDPFRRDEWSVLLCAPVPLAPLGPPTGPPVSILLIGSDHNNHGLFAQVERVLNQLHLADSLGLPPFVYLGRKVHAAPWSCDIGENQYFAGGAGRGANVWEYYFDQVSSYTLGAPTLNGRPVRLLLTSAEDARRHAIYRSRDAVTSYFEFKRYNKDLHEIRTRVRRMGAKLVHQWVRVSAPIRAEAAAKLRTWRAQATHLLGVHLRGTDKVTHPKIPLQRFLAPIDAYVRAHPQAMILLCSDDANYHAEMRKRYGARLVSASSGYKTDNIVRDPSIDKFGKGRSALLDALLLAHTDFLLKGTSSLSEFAMWYNPALIDRHLDLQIEGEGAASETYRSLIPKWFDGPYEPEALAPEQQPDAMLRALEEGTGGVPASGTKLVAAAVRQSAEADHAGAPPAVEQSGGGGGRGGGGGGGGARRRRRKAKGVITMSPAQRRRRKLRSGADASTSSGGSGGHPVPEWPLPATVPNAGGDGASGAPVVAHLEITTGTCAAHSRRLLTAFECEALAQHRRLEYIGATRELAEYPGCMRWHPKHVEYNRHATELMGCSGGHDKVCLCGPPTR